MLHLSSHIPSTIFYGSIFSELLRTARCTLRINDFIPRGSDLFSKMIAQDGNGTTLTKQLKKVFRRYQTFFQTFGKTHEEVNTSIMKNT